MTGQLQYTVMVALIVALGGFLMGFVGKQFPDFGGGREFL